MLNRNRAYEGMQPREKYLARKYGSHIDDGTLARWATHFAEDLLLRDVETEHRLRTARNVMDEAANRLASSRDGQDWHLVWRVFRVWARIVEKLEGEVLDAA